MDLKTSGYAEKIRETLGKYLADENQRERLAKELNQVINFPVISEDDELFVIDLILDVTALVLDGETNLETFDRKSVAKKIGQIMDDLIRVPLPLEPFDGRAFRMIASAVLAWLVKFVQE